jgi:hypothetical protein
MRAEELLHFTRVEAGRNLWLDHRFGVREPLSEDETGRAVPFRSGPNHVASRSNLAHRRTMWSFAV